MRFNVLPPYMFSRSTLCEAIGSSLSIGTAIAIRRDPGRHEKMIVCDVNVEELRCKLR